MKLHDDKRLHEILKIINKSKKPKLFVAMLTKAKALHGPSSIVDKPIEEDLAKELAYASWLAERLGELADKASRATRKAQDVKNASLKSIVYQEKVKLHCMYCKHETQRNLPLCPTCGKPQVFM